MNRRATVQRADLARVLHDALEADEHRLATFCGFERGATRADAPEVVRDPLPAAQTIVRVKEFRTETAAPIAKSAPYWRADRFTSLAPPPAQPPVKPFTRRDLAVDRTRPVPPPAPLMPYARLMPYLRRAFNHRRIGSRPDESRLVSAAAKLAPICSIPRRRVLTWPPQLRILIDARPDIVGFREDFNQLRKRIERTIGVDGCSVYLLFAGVPMVVNGQHPKIKRDGRRASAGGLLASLPPLAGAPTLVLSDLGSLNNDRTLMDAWSRYYRLHRRERDDFTFLMPSPRSKWDISALSGLRAVCWDRFEHLPASRRGHHAAAPIDPDVRRQQVEALLTRISVALQADPGVLRAARFAPDAERLDVGTEYEARWHADVERSGDAIAISPERVNEYRVAFKRLSRDAREAVARALQARHSGFSIAYRLEELLNLEEYEALCPGDGMGPGPDGAGLLTPELAQQARRRLMATLEQSVFQVDTEGLQRDIADWMSLAFDRASASTRSSADTATAYMVSEYVLTGQILIPADIDQDAAMRMASRLADIKKLGEITEPVRLQIRQRPGEMTALPWVPEYANQRFTLEQAQRLPRPQQSLEPALPEPVAEDAIAPEPTARIGQMEGLIVDPWAFGIGLPAAHIIAANILVTDELENLASKKRLYTLKRSNPVIPFPVESSTKVIIQSETARVELKPWSIPAWAAAAGCDRCGDYVEIELNKVLFRFRWVPPGSFMMGSPEDEPGRSDDEALHPVTISRGFWLGETPCTQAQWIAVMGANPSGFKGEDLPVEQVIWTDCLEYCARLNAMAPGLNVRLPSEAEWEYACRAGTASAFNDGSPCAQPVGLDPALDQLGWYRENSDRKTHVVADKPPNSWGLHDMHGNVWEWCLDAYARYETSDRADPFSDGDDGANRVIRGGGWYRDARYCRSAFRIYYEPGYRYDNLGFRLLAGQEPEAEWQRRAGGSAEHGPRDEDPTGAPKATKRARRRQ